MNSFVRIIAAISFLLGGGVAFATTDEVSTAPTEERTLAEGTYRGVAPSDESAASVGEVSPEAKPIMVVGPEDVDARFQKVFVEVSERFFGPNVLPLLKYGGMAVQQSAQVI